MKIRQSFKDKLRILAKLFRDPATPLWMKIVMIFCIIYVISPIDAIPDVVPIPLLGLVDDILLIIGITYGLASTRQGKEQIPKDKHHTSKAIIEGR